MNKAIKYRLYPTKKQTEYFLKCFGCCRFVYNQALNWRMAAYKADGTSLNYNDTAFGLTALKHQFAWLKEADSIALQQALRNLDKAYDSFFKKNGRFPKFKSAKRSRKSFTTINQNGTVALSDNSVKLPKVGIVKAKIHRKPLPDWKLKSATVSMDSDGKFYVSCLFEFDNPIYVVPTSGKAIGLDYKSDGLYMDSDGNVGSNHKYYRESHDKLAKEQRRLARKQKGSNRYKRQQQKVAKCHRHIANQRRDFLHRTSKRLINENQVIAVEDLNVSGMIKNRHVAKSIADSGWSEFMDMLEYKARWYGVEVLRCGRFDPSSKMCECGYINTGLTLSMREWECPRCGAVIDRDVNAAKNILKFAVARAVNGRGGIVRPANQDRFSSLGLWAEPCEASSPGL